MLFTYERIQQLNDLEFIVYSTILSLEKQIIHMKIRTLADEAHVSTTVILNFCKKMDCDGWADFKSKFKEHTKKQANTKTTAAQPIIQYFKMYDQNKTLKESINNVIRIVHQSRKVMFIGAGPSGVLAKYGALYLSSMGKSAQYIDTPYYSIPEDDFHDTVIIALSVSGETKSVINRLTRFKLLKATIISITNNKNNTMAKMSDVSLTYYVPHEEFMISERTQQIHVTATTQIPVLHFIEYISKQIHQLNEYL
ncbi:MurR/RpiR family transcriptional regulator [Enterococcus sp. N342-3-1-2]